MNLHIVVPLTEEYRCIITPALTSKFNLDWETLIKGYGFDINQLKDRYGYDPVKCCNGFFENLCNNDNIQVTWDKLLNDMRHQNISTEKITLSLSKDYCCTLYIVRAMYVMQMYLFCFFLHDHNISPNLK